MAKPKEGFHDLFAQIPEELWQALAAEADREQRSITGQLIYLLKQRYPDAETGQSQPPDKKRPGRPRKVRPES